MNKAIKEVIKSLEKDMDEKFKQIELLESLDLVNPIDEEIWCELCQTPLRNTDTMIILLKNIFPNAENVEIGYNCICFNLYGFKCKLPTFKNNTIKIDTSWFDYSYFKNPKLQEESYYYTETEYNMKKYFEALDNNESWKILFDYRLPSYKNNKKIIKFLLWFLKYKWKNDNRSMWEIKFKERKEEYEQKINNYDKMAKEIDNKIKILRNKLIPELKKFTYDFNYSPVPIDSMTLLYEE